MIINVTFHVLRVLILRIKNFVCTHVFRLILCTKNVQKGKHIQAVNGIPSLIVHSKSRLCKIGNNVSFRSYLGNCWNSRMNIVVNKNATFIIGDNSGISGSLIYCTHRIEIGNNVMIGGGCRIFDTNFHPIEAGKRRNPETCNEGNSSPIFIEDDVFIGTSCIIGKGVRIGRGSIVAAGSVVVKSIPENEIWGGNPARFLKKI